MTDGDVLLIDDDADVGEMIEMILEMSGYHCAIARNGVEALAALRAGPLPRVILLDVMMPDMSGPEFRAAQLRDPQIADVPVVLMTGDTNAGQKAAALGIERWLRKPVGIDDLLAAVRHPSGRDQPEPGSNEQGISERA